MTRPKKSRIVARPPLFSVFKPAAYPRSELETLNLTLDEYEAIRLVDFMGLDHGEAAQHLEISRPTVTRLIEQARKKLAEFIVEGRLLTIDGGVIHFAGNIFRCLDCGTTFNADINTTVSHCPSCASQKLDNQAERFGHGRCCRYRKNRR